MNFNITLPERMLLECLTAGNKSLTKIREECHLSQQTSLNIIQSLITKNLVVGINKEYSINKYLNQDIRSELHSQSDLLIEIGGIVSSCVRDSIQDPERKSFKLKKVFMNERENKIYNGLVYNLEAFLYFK